MKSGRQIESRGVRASSKCGIRKGSKGFNKARKTTSKQSNHARGKDKVLLDGKENCSPSKDYGGTGAELPGKVSLLTERTSNLPVIDLHLRHTLPSDKIKLQLFPLNEGTRMRLEKGGHNPYLELTLRAGKKITSIIKHFHSKWGSCSTVVGEPMLFQYNAVDNISSCKRWTLNDSKLSAADVYAAIGSPPIFRLRYGWLPSCELGNYASTHMSPLQYCSDNGGIEGHNSKTVAKYDGANDNVASETSITRDAYQATDEIADLNVVDEPVNFPDNDSSKSIGLGQLSELLMDGSTNISIGGLLSEASLMGKLNYCGPKSFDGKIGLQTNQIISDSLDAFIASQASPFRCLKPLSEDLRSSILDADETCHGFSLQNVSSSTKDSKSILTRIHSRSWSRDGDKSSNLSSTKKVDGQGVTEPKVVVEGSGTDLSLNRQTNDDERSLGLIDIKWADSLGPFDLGLPTTQKLIGGDSVSLTGFGFGFVR